MMESAAALRLAIELVHIPSQVRLVRAQPLPDGVLLLLRIAAGDADAEGEAARLTYRPRDVIRRAAVFFIEQVLLCSDADSYRVLGATPQASSNEIRRNMALLLRWLHPDLDRDGARSVLAKRVTLAWDAVKTPERRAAYDRARDVKAARRRSGKGGKTRATTAPFVARRTQRRHLLRRSLLMLLGRPQP